MTHTTTDATDYKQAITDCFTQDQTQDTTILDHLYAKECSRIFGGAGYVQ